MNGIKELKEIVEFIGSLVTAADQATQDGISIEDVATFVAPMLLAPAAFAGLDEAKLELADLSQDELKELNDALAIKLDLVNDDLEGLVEKALNIALEVYAILQKVKELKA